MQWDKLAANAAGCVRSIKVAVVNNLIAAYPALASVLILLANGRGFSIRLWREKQGAL
jgi:hypothetical protein